MPRFGDDPGHPGCALLLRQRPGRPPLHPSALLSLGPHTRGALSPCGRQGALGLHTAHPGPDVYVHACTHTHTEGERVPEGRRASARCGSTED